MGIDKDDLITAAATAAAAAAGAAGAGAPGALLAGSAANVATRKYLSSEQDESADQG
ncbi:hypothetical protein [Nocardioides perillae]|uniref:Uncharacterized protein n=1 Tax=Nocardioides perillae TaxID=1119534 RepID=A0A7Y9RVC6_9ACTN|nr:hypothetical protein [Nocardioides perillae]NYG55283.1 hypothetical protein [Nocardioides perillae]